MKPTMNSLNSHKITLKNFISNDLISSLMDDCKRKRIFDPATTLYCFLHQVLSGCSGIGAVINLNIQRKKEGLKLASINTAAFTCAKKKLSEDRLIEIAKKTGEKIDAQTSFWKWRGKNVYLVDGTVINLEDTKEIKNEYPLTYSNVKQQGQPKLRLLGLFSQSSGAFLDGEIGKYSGKGQSEITLMQKMLPRIKAGSVLVLDRFFTSYFLQNMFIKHGIDYVIRGRDNFVKKGLGRSKDKIIELEMPSSSSYKSYQTEGVTKFLKVRMIKSTIKRDGFRTATIYIMTSFLDQKKYPKAEIEKLYLSRWEVELDIRNLKCTLGASQLRSKSSTLARKELWVNLIAYNLIRNLNVQISSVDNKIPPRKRSFKMTLKSYIEVIRSIGSRGLSVLVEMLMNKVLNSKYRREPRALKKRKTSYCYLTVSRNESKKEVWGYARRKGHKGLSRIEGA